MSLAKQLRSRLKPGSAALAECNTPQVDGFPGAAGRSMLGLDVGEICIAGILRSAWSTFRLDAIRGVVQQTICDLEELGAGQVLGREPSRSELEGETGSLRVALDACCHELRDGCGLPTSPGLPVQVQSMRAADADWSESFSHALEAYRSAACDGLDASLAALALPPESVSKPVPAG
jgi:hypothetical protein